MVEKIIKIKSTNYLKPFQLSTVMTYVQAMYHSNDYQFWKILLELLNITKIQIKFWKEQRHQMQQEMEELQNLKEIQLSGTDLSQINSFTGSEKYGGISRITK